MPLVSIIIPIYNAGSNLKECIDSLVKQSLTDIEIICVLDAPTDLSIDVVKTYASKDSRIKIIINKQNIHIAESRNKGMSIAEGEYIGFSDHDDTRDLAMYEILYKKAKESGADIVFSNSIIQSEEKSTVVKYHKPIKESIIESIILPMNSNSNYNKLSKSVWASIYKKKFIEEHALVFKDRRIFYEEDTLFNLRAFLFSEKIAFVNKEFYVWKKHSDTQSTQSVDCVSEKQMNLFVEMLTYIKEAGEFKKYRRYIKILLSEYISDKNNYSSYLKLSDKQKERLFEIFKEVPFLPIRNELILFGRRNMRLIVFTIKIYLFAIKKHLSFPIYS
jgi:glycosyltransferase involved in cell wall biosynthesis